MQSIKWLTALLTTNMAQNYVLVERPMTWPDAEAHCVGLGGHLTSISSDCDNDAVFDQCLQAMPNPAYDEDTGWLETKYTKVKEGCWIGLNTQGNPWEYPEYWTTSAVDAVVWSDGTNGQWDVFHHFGPDFSLHGGVVGECGFISVHQDVEFEYQWIMADCEQFEYPFICELDECQDESTTTYGDCFDFYECGNKQKLQCECVDASEAENEEGESIGISKAESQSESGLPTLGLNGTNCNHNATALSTLEIVLIVYSVCTTIMLCVWWCYTRRSKRIMSLQTAH